MSVDSCRLRFDRVFMSVPFRVGGTFHPILDLNKVQAAGSKVKIAGRLSSSPSWMLADPDAATRRSEMMGNNFVWNWSCRLKA